MYGKVEFPLKCPGGNLDGLELEELVLDRLNFLSRDLNGRILVDHFDGQNKSHTVSLFYQCSLDALH